MKALIKKWNLEGRISQVLYWFMLIYFSIAFYGHIGQEVTRLFAIEQIVLFFVFYMAGKTVGNGECYRTFKPILEQSISSTESKD